MLSVVALAATNCEPFCASPCVELNGNVAIECGGCTDEHACRPGAPGFRSATQSFVVDANGAAAAAAASSSSPSCTDRYNGCAELARQAGSCLHAEMRVHCAATCGACDDLQVRSDPCASQHCDARRSLADDYFDAINPMGQRECAASATLLRASRCEDSDLEDERRMADRGYFVLRRAVPPDERDGMAALVQEVPNPTRLMCGASDVQPRECMLHAESFAASFPRAFDAIDATLRRWLSSGLAAEARLGWPLMMTGGEFISINRSPFSLNASCVLAAVFAAAREHVSPSCASSCPALHSVANAIKGTLDNACWLECHYNAIVHRMPKETIRRVLSNAMRPDATCEPALPPFLDGPIEYVMGGAAWFDFGATDVFESGRGHQRLISNLKAWLTSVSNVSVYEGWHDWHMDGPAEYGRYHKAFVMIAKGSGGAAAEARQRTNVRLVPAHSRYAHADCMGSLSAAGGSAFDAQERGEPTVSASVEERWRKLDSAKSGGDGGGGTAAGLEAAWGLDPTWRGLDRLACDVPLDAGDVLFFREDVWHRTQDMTSDRLALIFDILRLPLPEKRVVAAASSLSSVAASPSSLSSDIGGSDGGSGGGDDDNGSMAGGGGTTPPELHRAPRVHQGTMLRLLTRLPPHALDTALLEEQDAATAAECSDARVADASLLPHRGFALARRVLDAEAMRAALDGLESLRVDKVEAEGRVYSEQLSASELRTLTPSLHGALQALLDGWHARSLLWRVNGGGEQRDRLTVGGAQFVSVDPAMARRNGCPECETAACQAERCRPYLDWHVDGEHSPGQPLHKLWVLLSKGHAELASAEAATASSSDTDKERAHSNSSSSATHHANIVVAPSTGLDLLGRGALRALEGRVELQHGTGGAPDQSRDERDGIAVNPELRDSLLERVGCALRVEPGDAVFFEADVYHRTQDLLAERVALLVNVHRTAHTRAGGEESW